MKLSEAIRLGSMLKPQVRGRLSTSNGTCALGAAYEAHSGTSRSRLVTGPLDIFGMPPFRGERAKPGEIVTVISTPSEWSLMWRSVPCPACATRVDSGDRIIPHLNDDHKWTREQIADWVETIERAHDTPADGSVARDAEHAVAAVGAQA